MIDTHCHVHFRGYGAEAEEVIRRAKEAGVLMLNVGTNLATSREALACAESHDGVLASVGLHPNHATTAPHHDEEELEHAPPSEGETFDSPAFRELAKHPKCVAIGECGLDYYRMEGESAAEKQKQLAAVRAQFDLATEADKPVIIHCRDAHADQAALINEYVDAGKLSRRGVIHCFTGTLEEANAYIELGFLISFTGIITFPPRKTEGAVSPLQQVVKELPLESILIETDSPYLTPVPFRGKRNEPAHVKFVAEKIAELKGLSTDDVARATTENATRLFQI
jgi:TatD DNase family protein